MKLLDKWADRIPQETFNNIMIAIFGFTILAIVIFSSTVIGN